MLRNRFLKSVFLGAIGLGMATPVESRQSLPPSYDEHISAKKAEISALVPSQADGFVFWTDTHFKAYGESSSSEIISLLLDGIPRPKAIWGGDAITAYTNDIEKCWRAQTREFARLDKDIRLMPVRGNHDLTARESKDVKAGYSLSPKATFKAFDAVTTKGVIRNPKDKNGLYYYYDETETRIRYIVVDMFESFDGTDVFWGVKPGVSEKQLVWLVDEAIGKAPEGWGLVFAMHSSVGFDLSVHKSYVPLAEAIETLPTYRPDLKVLLVLGGHRHHDMQIVRSGVWYVMTASDATYQDYARSPFSPPGVRREKGTSNEHVIDYISVSKDMDTVSMIRIGYGSNRTYHLTPIEISVGESIQMPSEGIKTWVAYDSERSKYSFSNTKWYFSCEVAGITPNGRLFALSAGDSVLAAIDSIGNLQFYYLKVK